ncbi:hypothetical protein LEP1GSC041_4547 [Leptospira noguchii str. 2006001870]|uniref:Uncharacterized protein n=1 Tax=Leptospira noguchii serovar Autumnalis str. ZUN142 TaxID=1085540 RepID=M6U720_9LEPT|nr:hypothetical protein LEP1GSC041_4547 [Leptospira noguchii str. 2006001870]EMO38756.1 hypothetical protein LEP1GSC186_2747 [Leptospira noguchii serovar Autumnalis str. ZUN142]
MIRIEEFLHSFFIEKSGFYKTNRTSYALLTLFKKLDFYRQKTKSIFWLKKNE